MAQSWAPVDTCSLPTAEQPLRVAEFDSLFSTCLVEVERLSRTRLRMVLAGDSALPSQVRDLADRETACCSFFAFDIGEIADSTAGSAGVRMDIAVPIERSDILDALQQRAIAARVAGER
jgi:hypothetical protein